MTDALREVLGAEGRTMIISHSLGTVVSYDCLWTLSWDEDVIPLGVGKVDTWVTLGSPLADEVMKKQVFGADENGSRRYPSNVNTWFNIAAKHDYIAVDSGVRNDYRGIIDYHGTTISDKDIYNLARRDGESHPHSSLGYLIHPTFSKVLHDWLVAS